MNTKKVSQKFWRVIKHMINSEKKFIFIFLICIFLSLSSYGAIQIKTIEELQKIGNDPSYPLDGDYELANDIDASDTINWNDGKGFLPIGAPTDTNPNRRPFIGTFNGKKKVIKNLYIDRKDDDYIGLFSQLGSNGSIKVADVYDVTIENSTDYNIIGKDYVGTYAGYMENSKIRFCFVAGKIEGGNFVGSLVGYSGTNSLILGVVCYIGTEVKGNNSIGGVVGGNKGIIGKTSSSALVRGNDNIGGITGGNEGLIKWCVTSEGSQIIGNNGSTGGLVGFNESEGNIIECQSDSSVSGVSISGGLVGSNKGSIIDCFSQGPVKGTSVVGGLVGWNSGSILRTYAIGLVTGTTGAGGLVGINSGSVISSFWNTETSGLLVSADGVGKTTQEMFGTQIYIDWDFDFVWKETIYYPKLLLGQEDIFLPGEKIVDDVIMIWTIEQLTMIGNVYEYPLNGTYMLARDIDAQSTAVMNSGAGFKPIGTRRNPFTGRFYGNDNKIVNLFINSSYSFTGLFGFVGQGAYIERVGIENATVNGISYVGALAGYNQGGRIVQCNAYRVGVQGISNVGVLVGGNAGTIEESFTLLSRVTGPATTEMGFAYGGLVGSNIGDIRKCYSFCYVDGNTNIGGLVGENAFGGNILRS
ncbi:MAG: hypothetical protein LDL53_07280, partial [Candidatus Hydrogenedens sp.]|nr:hypothetical protein [Candidatus Hydrogenedens sp.]